MTSNRFLADDLSRTTFEFGIDLYKLLTNGNSCNIFFSPFSISTLLSLVGMGASGSTARQIGSVLRTPPEQLSSLCLSIKNYLTLIKGTKTDVSLSSASRMYVANRVTVLSDFETKARDIFEASIVKTNFVADPVRVASEINSWVAEKTCNKITNIVSQENLSSVTAMLLINAVHFKGKWTNEFKTSDTKQKPFRKSNHEVNDVSMMTQTDYFRIGQSEDLLCDVIELPYGRRDLSLFIFLPYDVEGLNDLEVKLSSERIRRAMCELVTDEVNLSLPKFCMESSFDLSDVLMSLGMTEAFQESVADLSGIDGTKTLSVSRVQHKAFVDVNEEGTEAAAVTSMDCVDCASQPRQFAVDHPFMFIIRDNRADVNLFIGRVVKPEYKKM